MADLRAAILWCIRYNGGSYTYTYTYVIRNMLSMKCYFAEPFRLTTTQVRRELKRMELDGIVKRVNGGSRAYLAWARTEAAHG